MPDRPQALTRPEVQPVPAVMAPTARPLAAVVACLLLFLAAAEAKAAGLTSLPSGARPVVSHETAIEGARVSAGRFRRAEDNICADRNGIHNVQGLCLCGLSSVCTGGDGCLQGQSIVQQGSQLVRL